MKVDGIIETCWVNKTNESKNIKKDITITTLKHTYNTAYTHFPMNTKIDGIMTGKLLSIPILVLLHVFRDKIRTNCKAYKIEE